MISGTSDASNFEVSKLRAGVSVTHMLSSTHTHSTLLHLSLFLEDIKSNVFSSLSLNEYSHTMFI
jgi:hypothetical protein